MRIRITNQPARQHVEDLEDAEILSLIDRHVFGQSLWCNGQSEFDTQTGQRNCSICGQIDEQSLADYIGNAGRHPRNVPAYSVQAIVHTMRGKPIEISASFDLLLRQTDQRTVRVVAIAALQALRVVDRSGHLR